LFSVCIQQSVFAVIVFIQDLKINVKLGTTEKKALTEEIQGFLNGVKGFNPFSNRRLIEVDRLTITDKNNG
jgi:hypothetical protein